MPHTKCAEPKRNPSSKNVGKSKGAKYGDPSLTQTAQKYGKAAVDQSRHSRHVDRDQFQEALVASSTLCARRCGTTYCCDVKDRGCLHMQKRWAEGESLLIVMVKGQRHVHNQQSWADEEGR